MISNPLTPTAQSLVRFDHTFHDNGELATRRVFYRNNCALDIGYQNGQPARLSKPHRLQLLAMRAGGVEITTISEIQTILSAPDTHCTPDGKITYIQRLEPRT